MADGDQRSPACLASVACLMDRCSRKWLGLSIRFEILDWMVYKHLERNSDQTPQSGDITLSFLRQDIHYAEPWECLPRLGAEEAGYDCSIVNHS